MISILAKYSCPILYFGSVYFVVTNKFCSVLFKYSGKYMFSKLPVLFTSQTRARNFQNTSKNELCKYYVQALYMAVSGS